MKRKVGYSWHLREVMARIKVYTATELVPMLHDRGIDLSASQVHRLVSGTPERLSLQVLSALCDILECTPADLVTTTAENAGVRRTATGDLPTPAAAIAKLRPRRVLALHRVLALRLRGQASPRTPLPPLLAFRPARRPSGRRALAGCGPSSSRWPSSSSPRAGRSRA